MDFFFFFDNNTRRIRIDHDAAVAAATAVVVAVVVVAVAVAVAVAAPVASSSSSSCRSFGFRLYDKRNNRNGIISLTKIDNSEIVDASKSFDDDRCRRAVTYYFNTEL